MSIEVGPKEGAGPFRRVRAPAPTPVPMIVLVRRVKASDNPSFEEKQQDERILEVVKELSSTAKRVWKGTGRQTPRRHAGS